MLEMLEILRAECISRYVTIEKSNRRVIVAFELVQFVMKITTKRAGNEKLLEFLYLPSLLIL